jgi:hypothetical protein
MYIKHREITRGRQGPAINLQHDSSLVLPDTFSASKKGASAFYMLHLWFKFGYLDTCQAAILSLLNEGHLDRMLRNLNKIILSSKIFSVCQKHRFYIKEWILQTFAAILLTQNFMQKHCFN